MGLGCRHASSIGPLAIRRSSQATNLGGVPSSSGLRTTTAGLRWHCRLRGNLRRGLRTELLRSPPPSIPLCCAQLVPKSCGVPIPRRRRRELIPGPTACPSSSRHAEHARGRVRLGPGSGPPIAGAVTTSVRATLLPLPKSGAPVDTWRTESSFENGVCLLRRLRNWTDSDVRSPPEKV